MLGWLIGKQVPQGINVEGTLLEIHADVKAGKENSGHTRGQLDTLSQDFNQHRIDDEGYKLKLKNEICQKIDDKFGNFQCPDKAVIDELKKKDITQNGEIKKIKEKAKTCSDTVKGWKIVKEVKKSIWRNVKVILTTIFLGMGAIAGFTTWLMGLWG